MIAANRQRLQGANLALHSLRTRLPGYRVHGAQAGTMLLVELPAGTETSALVAAAERRGVLVGDIEEMRLTPDPAKPGLLLGYGCVHDRDVDDAVAALAQAITDAAIPSVA